MLLPGRLGHWWLAAIFCFSAVALAASGDTAQRYQVAPGRYTADRARLHESIVARLLAGGTISHPPRLILTAGVPGAGKTTLLRELAERGDYRPENYVAISTDRIKPLLPEFAELSKTDPYQAHVLTQAEAQFIARLLLRRALAAGKNIVIDTTLLDLPQSQAILREARASEAGYRILLFYVRAADFATIRRRIEARSVREQRPFSSRFLDYVREAFEKIDGNVAAVSGMVDAKIEFTNDDELMLHAIVPRSGPPGPASCRDALAALLGGGH